MLRLVQWVPLISPNKITRGLLLNAAVQFGYLLMACLLPMTEHTVGLYVLPHNVFLAFSAAFSCWTVAAAAAPVGSSTARGTCCC